MLCVGILARQPHRLEIVDEFGPTFAAQHIERPVAQDGHHDRHIRVEAPMPGRQRGVLFGREKRHYLRIVQRTKFFNALLRIQPRDNAVHRVLNRTDGECGRLDHGHGLRRRDEPGGKRKGLCNNKNRRQDKTELLHEILLLW